MARPKKRSRKVSKAPTTDERIAIVQIKGSQEYAAWLERLHKKTMVPKVSMFRAGIALWAKQNGHEPPPEL
jgi:hypothetical protein